MLRHGFTCIGKGKDQVKRLFIACRLEIRADNGFQIMYQFQSFPVVMQAIFKVV